jgi:hypothetical protein
MSVRSAIALITGLALAGCAAAGTNKAGGEDGAELSARLAGATFGRAPGQPVSCVEVAQLTGNRALGRPLLLFEARDGRLYANRVQSCPNLRYGYSVRLKTVSARLCRGHQVEILDTRGAVVPGTCTIGDFLTYEPRTR